MTAPPPRTASGVRHLLLAVQFYTRIPVTGRLADWVGFSPAMLASAAAHFPAAGWLVGGFTAAVLTGAGELWPPAVAAVLATAAGLWLTGAFHEDGLADTADGLGGTVGAQRSLEIMRDSRIGTYGAAALTLALLLKTTLLSNLLDHGAGTAAAVVVVAHVVSRFAVLLARLGLPYVGGTDGKAKPMAGVSSPGGYLVATAWALPAAGVAALALQAGSLWLLLGAALPAAYLRQMLRRRLGGVTGDGLGATQQVAELGIYLAAVATL